AARCLDFAQGGRRYLGRQSGPDDTTAFLSHCDLFALVLREFAAILQEISEREQGVKKLLEWVCPAIIFKPRHAAERIGGIPNQRILHVPQICSCKKSICVHD